MIMVGVCCWMSDQVYAKTNGGNISSSDSENRNDPTREKVNSTSSCVRER